MIDRSKPSSLYSLSSEQRSRHRRQPDISGALARAFPGHARVLDLRAQVADRTGERAAPEFGPAAASTNFSGALERRPQLVEQLRKGRLEGKQPEGERHSFSGVILGNLLQELGREASFDAVFQLRELLADRGRVLAWLSELPEGQGPALKRSTGEQVPPTVDELKLLFERVGLRFVEQWVEDSLVTNETGWTLLLFEFWDSSGVRPIDLIETVISRDRKVATYKLALLRAVSEIAITQQRCVSWRAEGEVAVPLSAIVDRWVFYYWALFLPALPGSQEQPVFLPQMQGDWKKRRHGLGFARELEALMSIYRAGGMDAFAVDLGRDALTPQAKAALGGLKKKLRRAIVEGPVKHAGGTRKEGSLFKASRGFVLVKASLWRELSLMGHWIQDSILLRWAREVERLSDGNVTSDRVVPRLLRTPQENRDQSVARDIFSGIQGLECVWTGRSLREFAIDHVIPFAYWHNNDLWNLLPASPKVNLDKSNKLPARELVLERRDAIIGCWETARAAHPPRFDREVNLISGSQALQLGDFFQVFLNDIEETARRRQTVRWRPRA